MNKKTRFRILQISGTHSGGSWLYDQATTLAGRGHDVKVILPAPGPLVERLNAAGIQTFIIPFKGGSFKNLPRVIRAQWTMLQLVRSLKPDIIHSHLIKAVFMGRIAGFFARVPIRVSQHPGSVHLDNMKLRFFDRATLWMDTVTIGSCADIAHRYSSMGARKVAVNYYGCHVETIDPNTTGNSFRAEFAIGAGTPSIGIVAHMYPSQRTEFREVGMKGHEIFLDAAKIVLGEYPNSRFFVVGDEFFGNGDYRRKLESRTSKLDIEKSVTFTGHRSDIPNVMAAMDVLVNPSLSESASYTMVEALLMRKGVVASNVGGLPDTVQHEETGILVPPKDKILLASAILRQLRDPTNRIAMASLGRKRMLVMFDIEKTVDDLEDIYETANLGRKSKIGTRKMA